MPHNILLELKQMASELQQRMVAHRRHLHRKPELSFVEIETAAYIANVLKENGITVQTAVAGHGVVGTIEGKGGHGRCVALRADMDALPIQEESLKPYASENVGVMHACGHDAHMAMLLGAAEMLQRLKDKFAGVVKLIFQPAEEQLPGGAKAMIAFGVLQNPDVEAIVALHVSPDLPSGTLGFCPGAFMASGDEINILIKGKGGHAAHPDKTTDVVLTAAQVLVNLQQLVSRNAPPGLPVVLSFGRLVAEGAHNILPQQALLQGTLRTFDEAFRAQAKRRITQIATHIASAAEAEAEVLIVDGYPVLINHPALTRHLMAIAESSLGSTVVQQLPMRMTTEDFAYYSQQVPACFIRLGTANREQGITAGLHTPQFDIHEPALQHGATMLALSAIEILQNGVPTT